MATTMHHNTQKGSVSMNTQRSVVPNSTWPLHAQATLPAAVRQQQRHTQLRRSTLQPVQALASSTRQPLQQRQPVRPSGPQQHRMWHGQRAQQPLVLLWAVAPASGDSAAADDGSELDPNIPAVDQDFDLLGAEVKKLQELLADELKGCSVYLIGMMGSGKSTTGKMLANTLNYAFFDTDDMIERAHPGDTVADLFKKYGEDYFRRCEEQVLKELAPFKSLVVATGGGAVTRPKNWSYMHNGIVAWLKGEPALLARRVVAEGIEKRPLLFGEGVSESEAYDISLSKLNSLLEDRTKFYENADVAIDLRGYGKDEANGAPTAVVMHRLMDAISQKIQATKEEREARRQFTIERAGDVPSMRKQQSPSQQQQQAAEE